VKKVLRVGLDKRVGANFGSTDNSMHSLIKYTFLNKGSLFFLWREIKDAAD
jgi:hypothetical protein